MDTFTRASARLGALSLFILAFAVGAHPAAAQEPRAGVVTKVVGTATVARATLPQPAPLHFKDDVLLHDRITTGENSAVRVLLGGKATVTARERSVLTITEIPGTATVRLASGRAAVAVTKDKMKPGEIVEIRTPNAVVAVRGTVVIAEVEPAMDGYRSTITILKGLVDVTKLDGAGRPTGAAVDVKMLERVTVTTPKPIGAPEKITRQTAEGLASQFSFVPKAGPAASTEALNAQVKEAAIHDAIQVVGGGTSDTRSTVVAASTATAASVSNTAGSATTTTSSLTATTSTATSTTTTTVTTTTGNTVTTTTAPVVNAAAPVVNDPVRTVTNPISQGSNLVPAVVKMVTGTASDITSTNPGSLLKK